MHFNCRDTSRGYGIFISSRPGCLCLRSSLAADTCLCAVDKEAGRQNKSAVVVLDEFQETANFDDDEIERKMRSVFQNHRNVSYIHIFMGSKTHLMRDIFNNPNRPFYKSGKHFPLGKIDHEELSLFAKKKFSDQGIVIDDNDLNSILNNTECRPYYFQMLCNVLWDVTVHRRQGAGRD